MKRRKLLALLLSLSLALGMTTVAFAAGEGEYTQPGGTAPTDVSGSAVESDGSVTHKTILYAPTIKITINNPTQIIVNPYGLKFSSEGTDAQKQIISNPTIIQNKSQIKVTVSGTPTATMGGELQLYDDKITLNNTKPAKGLYLEMQCLTGANESAVDQNADFDAPGAALEKTAVKMSGSDTVTFDLDASTTPSGNAYGAYRITGGTYTQTTAQWTTSDTVALSIVFDISASTT